MAVKEKAAAGGKAGAKSGAARKKVVRKNIISGYAHINASFNNIFINITDSMGNTIAWSSAGIMGFKGSRKSTPYAAQLAAEDAAKKAAEHGMRDVDVVIKGPGAGRESALRGLISAGYNIKSIKDVTPVLLSLLGDCY